MFFSPALGLMFQAQSQKSRTNWKSPTVPQITILLCINWSYKPYNLSSLQRMPAASTMTMNKHVFRDKAEANERKDISILQYYTSRHTKWGYRLLVSDRRHLGYCSNSQASCFPILPALR